MKRCAWLAAVAIFLAGSVYGEEVSVKMNLVADEGVGKEIGTVTLEDSPYGLLVTPRLSGLPPGIHGFHVHEHANCQPAREGEKTVPAHAAGGHFDPKGTGRHQGPYGDGHLGDLPVLVVDEGGKATLPVLAPRLKVEDVKGRSLMIHAGGDNYSDIPEKLGGGGGRIACGVIR